MAPRVPPRNVTSVSLPHPIFKHRSLSLNFGATRWRCMRTSSSYYVHESWWAGLLTACLHRGDCTHCNEGTGQVVGAFLRRGKWHGPFKSRRVAAAKLSSAPDIAKRVTCVCEQ
jgi:hypothetical protein